MISDTHRDSILLKTFGPQTDFQSVAPNVAGSSPVSHPNFPAFLITSGFAHLLRHIGSPTLAVGTWMKAKVDCKVVRVYTESRDSQPFCGTILDSFRLEP